MTIKQIKQLILIFITLLFCIYSQAQVGECDSGVDSAKADYSRGVLRIYIFGLANSHTYGNLLKKEYGIEAVYYGCVVEQKWQCYTDFMAEKIKAKLGNDVFEKLSKKSQFIDSSGMGDRECAFPGGPKELMKFVYCNLDLNKANHQQTNKVRVFTAFTIDTTGRPVNIKVLKSPNESYSKEALRIIKLMPDWITATHKGKKIEQQWNLPILFDQDWKQKQCE